MLEWDLKPKFWQYEGMSRSDEELALFNKEYSAGHVELKLVVYGYDLYIDKKLMTQLDTYSFIKVIVSSGSLEDDFRKINLLESIVTLAFNTTKSYGIRYSKGSGTLFPINRNFDTEYYPHQLFIMKNDNVKEIIADWAERKAMIGNYLDRLFKRDDLELMPVYWYSKGVLSNDYLSAFLNFYRAIEVLSRRRWMDLNSKIQGTISRDIGLKNKTTKIEKMFKDVKIPEHQMIPIFFEEYDIHQDYKKWRQWRNMITHGDLSLEFNSAFINEIQVLRKTVFDLINSILISEV
jgi:hypothetical protein